SQYECFTPIILMVRRLTVTTILLILASETALCQQFLIPYQAVSDCGVERFFDIGSLSCVACGSNQRASETGSAMSSITKSDNSNGFGCIRCPGIVTDEGTCHCPKGGILGESPAANMIEKFVKFSFRCERCQASFINTSLSCVCGQNNGIMTVYPRTFLCVSYGVCKQVAYPQVFSNLTACQALGNMCVMNMHSLSSVANDACGLFNSIFRSTAALGSTQDIAYWRANLPWLFYGDQPGLASRVLQTDPLTTGFSFKGSNKNIDIKLRAAVYNARGEFLRWDKIGGGYLQLCPDTATRQQAAFYFGTAYQEKLLRVYPEPLFYDVFVDVGGGEDTRLLPLPTLILNQQYNGRFINQGESMKNWYLSRRVFLVDTLSGREKTLSATPKVIRVASSITIRPLVPATQKGQVFTPLMSVSYSDVLITDTNTQTVPVSFAVEYEMDQHETRLKTDTALGVMGGVAVLHSLLKTVSWKRRTLSPNIDMETMLRFLLFYAGDLANVFFIITVGTGLYWLIFYKAQQFVSVLLPLPAQEEQFVTYIGCAFAFKAIQFLHKLIQQLSIDVFFIDWERPRSKATASEPKRDPSPVSIWRTYFVANEWNEIQTIRKISPTFQIMAVLFLLEVVGFSSLALRDPWSTLKRSPEAYTPPYSLTLRYGLAATLWLCVGLLQVIFFTVFHERFVEDKIRQFVDLCSISNVSVLLLSHRCFGYYIHGRSVHGHSDTNMEEMNSNLKREAESLCGQRGLLPNTDTQTFQVSINNHLRAQYDRIREPLSRRNGPSRLVDASSANPFEQSTRAYNTLNRFLGSIIDHANRDIDYIVKDKLLFERVIGMEFLEPGEKSIFYNDEAHSFSDVLFYGNEATLLIFDTLFFCVVDLGAQSFVLAAVLTYIQQMVFRLIRNSFGRRNLASKTLVDQRFLI
uniref:Transmembrane protein 67 n=1 Tax=Myripristis murdjan TaxID=586833 RepID=A0A667XCU8_9TELE